MMKRLLFAGLLAVGLCHAQTASAQAYGWTRLVNAGLAEEKGHSGGMCVDVPGDSKKVGTVLAMWPCHNKANQRFWLMDYSLEHSRIAVFEGANARCLSYPSQAPLANIVIDTCDKAPKWRTASTGEISTPDFKHCISIAPDGRLALTAHCNPFDPASKTRFGSSWHIRTLGMPYGGGVLDNNGHALVNEDDYACLDIKGASRTPGADLVHWPCHGQPNQLLRLMGEPGQVFITVYGDAQMLCLSNVGEIDNGHLPSTQAVPCNRSDRRQAWNVIPPTGGMWGYTLSNEETGQCLDAFTDSSAVGAWPCHGGNNQRWGLLRLSGSH